MNDWPIIISAAISGLALITSVWKVTAFCRWWVYEAHGLLQLQHESYIRSRVKSHELQQKQLDSTTELITELKAARVLRTGAFKAGDTVT